MMFQQMIGSLASFCPLSQDSKAASIVMMAQQSKMFHLCRSTLKHLKLVSMSIDIVVTVVPVKDKKTVFSTMT